MLKFYGYTKCSTCRNAKKWLDKKGIVYQEIDITTQPPSLAQLKKVISQSGKEYKAFLNRSGVMYRELGMKDVVATATEAEIVKMLAEEGRLLKRPILSDGERATVGFKEAEWATVWL